MCCQVQHPTAVAPPASTHARLTRVCDMDGRSLPPRGLTALLSLEVFNLLNPTLFPLYPTYMERRVVPGRPLHRHGHSASWPGPAHPKPWGRINAWQGRQAGQLIPGTRRGVIFLRAGGCSLFFARGLMLICCSHLRAVRSTRRSSQELKKYETHWGSRAGSGHLLQCSISLQALSIFFTLFSVKWAATETEISRAAEDT